MMYYVVDSMLETMVFSALTVAECWAYVDTLADEDDARYFVCDCDGDPVD